MRPASKKPLRLLGLGLALLLGGLQLWPVERSNPPVTGDLAAPEDVAAILRRACYDCHSHESRWPWYAYVAPVSWLVAHDVEAGRAELNFSEWAQYSESRRISKASQAIEEIEAERMPLPAYLWMHGEARIAPAELDRLRRWADEVE